MNTVSYTDIADVTKFLAPAVLLLAITSGACAAKGGVPRPFPVATRSTQPAPAGTETVTPATPPVPAEPPAAAESLPQPPGTELPRLGEVIRTALGFLGTPYRNGGSDPSGFDCSGFVQFVFARHGTPLPREVRTQFQEGQKIDLDEVEPGDLVFFETVTRGASHVGIAVGDGRFVHAPSSRGVVRVEPYTASYWSRRFVGARRLSNTLTLTESAFPGAIRSSR
ncbi:MAG: C40 family peptidase [Acidobacteria bacterium]|nr:C40 family peptidase [Acidobacteriota bacterium]